MYIRIQWITIKRKARRDNFLRKRCAFRIFNNSYCWTQVALLVRILKISNLKTAIKYVKVLLNLGLVEKSKFTFLTKLPTSSAKPFLFTKWFFLTPWALDANLTLTLVNPIYTLNIMDDLQVCDKNSYFHSKPDVFMIITHCSFAETSGNMEENTK